jgi:hypothetical protein
MALVLLSVWGRVERPWGHEIRVDFRDTDTGAIHNEEYTFKTLPTQAEEDAAVAFLFLLAPVAGAQTPVPSPTPATTKLAFDHDGVNTDGYRLKIDAAAAVAITPTCAVVGSVRSCDIPFPALTPGAHTLIVIAWNIAGEAQSDPFAVNVIVVPAKATNIRIVK